MNNRGRFQAQGDNVEKSEAWAQADSLKKTPANSLLNSLTAQLTHRELEVRDIALQKARAFVDDAPTEGYNLVLIKKFNNPGVRKSIRVDVEIRNGCAFCNDDQA
jgi:hypothetical protein